MTWWPIARILDAWRSLRSSRTASGEIEVPPPLPPTQITEHFSWGEMGCRDGSIVPLEYRDNARHLCEQLEVLRAELGKPIRITSGYRSPQHNAKVKGAKTSQHLYAKAADIVVAGLSPTQVHAEIERLIKIGRMEEGGLGRYPRWCHYDVRGKRARWG